MTLRIRKNGEYEVVGNINNLLILIFDKIHSKVDYIDGIDTILPYFAIFSKKIEL